ncbi:hypothetical protein [Sporomusa sp.]|uniref:hypothetical protein n=1 Tax=Sporomusa sp. TaxID=2078658 RepID=UPI002BFF3AD4|nr:hypothetical protein [Sporomusa sp.]HWR09292.1 hypothetical protein [Sporomusa sp.]
MSGQVRNETEPSFINRPDLEEYFIQTGFYDLLPLAWQLTNDFGYGESEMIEAICKLNDKFLQYPPRKNRTAWFKTVFKEKLQEARSDILTFKAMKKFRR